MKLIDRQYLATPFYGARKIAVWLKSKSHQVNRKRVRRLMQLMELKAVYRHHKTSKPAPGHKIYPHLLSGMKITQPNQVWAADITYIPMARGSSCIWWPSSTGIAGMCSPGGYRTHWTPASVSRHWKRHSRRADRISSTPTGATSSPVRPFPGSCSSAESGSGWVEGGGIMITCSSERLWRTVKYEEVYLKASENGREARISLGNYFRFYNTEPLHQAIGYRTPAEVFTSTPVEATSRVW